MKILVPVDGSPSSKAALEFIGARTTLIGKDPQITVMNVQPDLPTRGARILGRAVVREYHEREAQRILRPAAARLKKSGLAVTTEMDIGDAAAAIAAKAERLGADLIVIGSHGQTALAGLAFGSVTTATLARTKHPVLVVRAKRAPTTDSLRVGLAVDGSRESAAALKYALRHIELFGANPHLVILHAVADFVGMPMADMAGIAMPAFSDEDIQAMRRSAFEAAVKPARALLKKSQTPAEEVCLAGPAGDELAAYANKKLDLLVMGSHGRGAFRAALLGSVATRVAARCKTPLLLIRRP